MDLYTREDADIYELQVLVTSIRRHAILELMIAETTARYLANGCLEQLRKETSSLLGWVFLW
jgi:hypothetical protein